MNHSFIVEFSDKDLRLDTFVAEKLNITRSKSQELIERKQVKVNNQYKPKSYRLKYNDLVEVVYSAAEEKDNLELIPQNIPVEILYKDDFIVGLSKPPGIVVYPSAGHRDGTVMNALAFHMKKLATVGGPLRPGVVHRLDKDTSGVLIVAIDDVAYYKLVELFKKREIKKEYIAIVYGELKGKGQIKSSIGRSESDRKKMSVRSRKGKEAITEWESIKNFDNYTLVRIKLITGRTHQIRVHFSSIGHPLLGDKTYGKKTYLEIDKIKVPVHRQMLHALKIEFKHPINGEVISLQSPLPQDMKSVIDILEQKKFLQYH